MSDLERVTRRLERERVARLEAERIAEQATADLYASVQDLERVSRRLVALQRTAEAANSSATVEEAAASALREVCTLTGWPIGHLYLVDARRMGVPAPVWHLADPDQYVVFCMATERLVVAPGVGLPGMVIERRDAVWIEDVTLADSFPRAEAARRTGVRTGFALPVMVDGDVAAVLEFFSPVLAAPDGDLMVALGEVATQLARVVERSRHAQDLRMSEAQNRMIVETANEAFVAIDARSVVLDWNRSAERLFGYSRDEVLGKSLMDTILPREHWRAHRAGMDRLIATGESQVLGKRLQFDAHRKDGWRFPIEFMPWSVTVGGAQQFFAFIEDVSERKDFEARLAHQALHDALTGLPNRTLLLDRIGHALARAGRDGEAIALLFLDLDRFKVVNDSLGHAAGDQLLRLVAERLALILRPGDTLARLGGDEFVVLCEPPMEVDTAMAIAERVVATLQPSFSLEDGSVAVSASVGVLLTTGGADPLALLADADLAMYRAKDAQRGSIELFDTSMRVRAVARMSLEGALREAIDKKDIEVHYQPIYDLTSAAVAGVEALARWNRPSHGAVGPSEFIPVAEDAGLIAALGQQVLDRSCRDISLWQHEDPATAPPTVMVNVSTRQLERATFVERVLGTIAAAGLPSRRVTLEITENILLLDSAETARSLWRLREAGVACAIDDFGTGYSSLDRLRRLPVGSLKVDRSFIAELGSDPGRSLVGGIIVMAHSLGLRVTAEGVETDEQLAWLRRLGCDEVQGFLLARPAPIGDLRSEPPGPHPKLLELQHEVDLDEQRLLDAVDAAMSGGAHLDPRARSLVRELKRLLELP